MLSLSQDNTGGGSGHLVLGYWFFFCLCQSPYQRLHWDFIPCMKWVTLPIAYHVQLNPALKQRKVYSLSYSFFGGSSALLGAALSSRCGCEMGLLVPRVRGEEGGGRRCSGQNCPAACENGLERGRIGSVAQGFRAGSPGVGWHT